MIMPANHTPLSALKSSFLPSEVLDPSSSWQLPPVNPNYSTKIFILPLSNDSFMQHVNMQISSNLEKHKKQNSPPLF